MDFDRRETVRIRNRYHAIVPTVVGAVDRERPVFVDDAGLFIDVFEGKDFVYFSAGAGGKGGPERTRKVDYDGALKIFDALEGVKGTKPRLIMVSAIDVRDTNVAPPSHYVSALLRRVSHVGADMVMYRLRKT